MRLMWIIPDEELLSFNSDILENSQDSFLEAGIALTWMMLKVKFNATDDDGKEVTKEMDMPLNLNKENERTFGGELWRYIEQGGKVELVDEDGQFFLKLPYQEQAFKDKRFLDAIDHNVILRDGKYNVRLPIDQVPLPIELLELAQQGKLLETRIDKVIYGETGGPIPVVDYLFTRRDRKGFVCNAERTQELPDRIAQVLMWGESELMSIEEIEKLELVKGKNTKVRTKFPWTDTKDAVHISMSPEEWSCLEKWLPAFLGKRKPKYKNKELTLDVDHFKMLCQDSYWQFTYRRFVRQPDDQFRAWWDPQLSTLRYPKQGGEG